MERNVTLDYFKVILSILVITIHVGPLTMSYPLINWLISQGIARIAVPCFFIINGYYLAKKIDDFNAVKKYLLHLLLIYAVWSVIYILLSREGITVGVLLMYCFLGVAHLWYIAGLIVGCLLLYWSKKVCKNDTLILIVSILLFVAGFLYEPSRRDYYDVRNGLFFGFPFIFFGYYIHKHNLVRKVKDAYLIPAIIISFTALYLESSHARYTSFTHDFYLSLMVCCPALILFIFKHSCYKKNSVYITYLGSLASAIYFVHYLAINVFDYITVPYLIVRFLMVVLLSVVLSICIIYVNKYVKIFL